MLGGRESRPWRFILVGVLAIVLLGATVANGATLRPSAPVGFDSGTSTTLREQVATETSACAKINSNDSLNQTYLSVYLNLPITPNSSRGTNATPPPPRAGYPNASTGERQLHDAWVSICESAEYVALYELFLQPDSGSGQTTGLQQTNGTTGDYETQYGFVYGASCSNASDFGGDACDYQTNWYADLVTGGVTGPITARDGPLPGDPRTGIQHGVGGIPPVLGLPGIGGYVISILIAAAVVGLVVVRVRSRRTGTTAPDSNSAIPTHRTVGSPEIADSGLPPVRTRAESVATGASEELQDPVD
jgi:hypothetical protein